MKTSTKVLLVSFLLRLKAITAIALSRPTTDGPLLHLAIDHRFSRLTTEDHLIIADYLSPLVLIITNIRVILLLSEFTRCPARATFT